MLPRAMVKLMSRSTIWSSKANDTWLTAITSGAAVVCGPGQSAVGVDRRIGTAREAQERGRS